MAIHFSLCEGQGGPELEPVDGNKYSDARPGKFIKKRRDFTDCALGSVRQARHFAKDDLQIELTDHEIDSLASDRKSASGWAQVCHDPGAALEFKP